MLWTMWVSAILSGLVGGLGYLAWRKGRRRWPGTDAVVAIFGQ